MKTSSLRFLLVPGALHCFSHNPSVREDLIKLIPELEEISDEVVKDGGRLPTGHLKEAYTRAVEILNLNIETLRSWAEGKESLLEVHYNAHRREVDLARAKAQAWQNAVKNGAALQPNPSNSESVEDKPNFPPLLKQLQNFSKASVGFVKSGLRTTPPEILAAREATCRTCPEWDAAALNGSGRCKKCGCSTWAKLRMATERCPLGKWEAVPEQKSPEQETTNQ